MKQFPSEDKKHKKLQAKLTTMLKNCKKLADAKDEMLETFGKRVVEMRQNQQKVLKICYKNNI